jgi:ubiquinone/menaquinone biosynthesis C-methylase UbiE
VQQKVGDYYDSFLASEPGKYSSLAEFNARYNPILLFLAEHSGTNNLTMLDVGCGTGSAAGKLKLFGRVCGVDVSPKSIELAKKVLDEAKVGSAENIDYPDSTFDVVVCTEVLEHVLDPYIAMMEFHRVLKPAGHLLITTPNPWNWLVVATKLYAMAIRRNAGTGQIVEHYLSPPSLKHLIRGSGFSIIDFRTVFFRPSCVKWLSPVAGLYQICIAKKKEESN